MAARRSNRTAVVLMALALFGCAALTAAQVGTADDSQRDFNVPGKSADQVTGNDFKSSLFMGFDEAKLRTALKVDATKSPGGFAVPMNQDNFPIINFSGMTAGLLFYEPKGQNSFHVHPRGNELVTVIKGGPLRCQVVDTKGKVFDFTLNLGDTGFFPQGLIHLQQNIGSSKTIAFQTFSSANPGVSRTIPAVFAGDAGLVSVGLNNQFNAAQVTGIKNKLVPGFPKAL